MSISGIGSSGFDISKMASKIVKDLDADGDGSINKAEFTKGMTSKGMSEADATEKFDSVDTKKTGSITQSDIETDLKNNAPQGKSAPSGPPPGGAKPGGSSQGGSSTNYDVKDTNKDGTVSAAEELVYEIKHPDKAATEVSTKSTGSNKTGTIIDVTA